MKAFVKDEFYPSFKHARGIYSRHDDSKVLLGPIFSRIEEKIFELKYFIKHVPSGERAAWMSSRFEGSQGARLIATDYTAFESHFSRRAMMMIEFELYWYMTSHLRARADFDKLLAAISGRNCVDFKHERWFIQATRMSGEMCTSLGNGFSNLMIFLYLTRDSNGFSDCVVEGDDLLGFTNGRVPTKEDYESLGFTVKIEYPRSFSEASFCGQIFDSETNQTVIDPYKTIVKAGWTNARYLKSSEKTRKELLRAKAMSILAENPNAPIVSHFAHYLLRVTPGKYRVEAGLPNFYAAKVRDWCRVKYPEPKISTRSREIVQDGFGFSIEEQLALEEHFRVARFGFVNHPLLFDHADFQHVLNWQNYVTYSDERYVVFGGDLHSFKNFKI